MNIQQQLKDAIKGASHTPAQIRWVTCESVNEAELTMSAVGLSDDVLYDEIQIGMGAMAMIPVIGSSCLVVIIENNESDGFLIAAEEVSKIIFNKGTLGGTVKLQALKDSLDSIKNYCETMKSAIETGFVAVGAGSLANGANGRTAFSNSMISGINISELENEKIQQ